MLSHFHHVPGRLRVSIQRLKNNRAAAATLQPAVLATPGAKAVSISVPIGSVVVHYDKNVFELDAFWAILRDLDLIVAPPEQTPVSSFDPLASAAANAIAKVIVDAVLERMLGPVGGAVVQLLL